MVLNSVSSSLMLFESKLKLLKALQGVKKPKLLSTCSLFFFINDSLYLLSPHASSSLVLLPAVFNLVFVSLVFQLFLAFWRFKTRFSTLLQEIRIFPVASWVSSCFLKPWVGCLKVPLNLSLYLSLISGYRLLGN